MTRAIFTAGELRLLATVAAARAAWDETEQLVAAMDEPDVHDVVRDVARLLGIAQDTVADLLARRHP